MSDTPQMIERDSASRGINAAADFILEGLSDTDDARDLINLVVNLGFYLVDNPAALAAMGDPDKVEATVLDAIAANYGGIPDFLLELLELQLPGIAQRHAATTESY